jgi:two-component system chemotaxis response regulator CheB
MGVTPIRVLLVDDSPLALALLKRMLATSPDVQVVGTACNGQEALGMVPTLDPQVICTDLHMPVMDGLAFTREVMTRFPRPILVISSTVEPGEAAKTYPVLDAGALDLMPKPSLETGADFDRVARDLVMRVRILAGVRVIRRAPAHAEPPEKVEKPEAPSSIRAVSAKMVVIGASTGGPMALRTILGQLSGDFRLPVICVQHISEGFLAGLVEWLGSQCRVKTEVARSGDAPRVGTVYFPPERMHLEMDARGRFRSSERPSVAGHRPSVTVTMNSVAEYYGRFAVGVLLTGMGSDGAEGMATIARAGGLTLAQNEESCVVFGMPRQAIERGAARHVLSPDEIAAALTQLRAA